ncbi:FG-GAP repeat domain-containing protein [Dactylosporangium sp. CA-139114]|uniref:FG-GAP repeat domain-containing protein n=1 Tax=Dactylosporangium sp. CA-139114 TaxID=3239931 RepID=UPI003D9790E2
MLMPVLLAAGAALFVPAPATAAPAGCAASRAKADEAGAVSEARRCRKRIEVLGRRSERSQTFAEADGSMVLESSAVPKRLRRADGSWADLDATLRKQADGGFEPAVAQTTARLSGGADRTLVSVPTDAGAWRLEWPAALPAPQVAGDTATYPEVFAGVDLRVQALADGFTYVFVVKTRAALASPQLRSIPMAAKGPAVRAAGDHLEVVGRDGATLLRSGAATAWDSSGEAKLSQVGLGLSGGDVVLTPDAAWLADPSLTLPVYIDPQWSSGSQRWTYSNSANFSYSNLGGVARVGRNPDGTGGDWREHFEFPYSTMAGSIIKAVSFKSTLVHTASCTDVQADLWRTADVDVTGRTAWTPVPYVLLSAASGHAHKPSEGGGCAGDPQPDKELSFQNQGNNTFISQAQAWADQGLSRVTLSLINHTEGASSQWMKFSAASTSFIVNYNRRPNTPDPATMSAVGTSQTVGCWTGDPAGQPWMNVTNGVTLRADVVDPDVNPGGGGDTIVAKFEWQDLTAGSPVATLPDTPGFPSLPSAPHTFTAAVPSGSLPPGHAFQWRVRGYDGQDLGAYSPWCHFGVDNGTPSQPLIASTDLPAFPANPPASTKVGRTATVTLSPGGGDTDIVGYRYSVTTVANPSMPTQYVAAAADGTASIPVVPLASGLAKTFLSVVALDAAGNRSPVAASAADAPGTRQFRANAADPATHVANDANGDGTADVVAIVDAPGGTTAINTFITKPGTAAPYGVTVPFVNAAGTFDRANLLALTGDFNGDGRADVAALRNEGGSCHTSLSWWLSDGNGYVPSAGPLWDSGVGNWCFDRVKAVAGDFTGDGKADIGAFYRYDGALTKLFVFTATGNGFSPPAVWWDTGAGNWDASRMLPAAGDFNGDGKVDIASFYDYGGCTAAVWNLTSTGTAIGAVGKPWTGTGSWCLPDTRKVLTGDVDGDGKAEFIAISGTTGAGHWDVTSWSGPGLTTAVHAGQNIGWSDVAQTKFFGGDFNGDGKFDIGHFYNYGGTATKEWTLTSTGTGFGPETQRWDSASQSGGLAWSAISPL